MNLTVRREDCEAAARTLLGSSDFTLEGCDVEPSENSGGLTGRYYKITARVSFLDGRSKKIMHLFAKTPPVSKSQRTFVVDCKYFHREVVFYRDVVPKMISGLPPGATLPFPRCALARDSARGWASQGPAPIPGSAEEELIVLEDLQHRGFVRAGLRTMDLQHCRAAVRALARFHAASIPLVHDSLLSDGLWDLDRERAFVTRSVRSTATAARALWPGKFGGGRRRGEALPASLEGAWARFHAAARARPGIAALVHGDAWESNFMFRYEGGSPVEAALVDFQIAQRLPPLYDVVFFLHVGTRREFREGHVRELLECYHGELSARLPPRNPPLLTFEALLGSYEDVKAVGPLISSAYVPKLLEIYLGRDLERSTLDAIDDLLSDRGERIARNCGRSKEYRDWVEECLVECLEVLGLWD